MNKRIIYLICVVALLFTCCEKKELAENIFPTCTIVSPKNKAEISLGEIVTIATNSGDPDGSIKEVRFYINAIGVGYASQFPFTYKWDTETDDEGIYGIKAEAIDDKNGKKIDIIEVTLIEPEDTSVLIDTRDNKTYSIIKIGKQSWMRENVSYKINSGSWPYNYDESQVGTYGRLYNWDAAKKACPNGWHLPTKEDWDMLANYISAQNGGYGKSGENWNEVGKHMKSLNGWENNGNGIDNFGFSAIPAGQMGNIAGSSSFMGIGTSCIWWSATEYSGSIAWNRFLSSGNNKFSRYNTTKEFGYSVRCVRD